MAAVTDLWKSERGFLTILIIIAATVLAALGHLPITDWTDLTKFIFVTYVGGKTATGIAERLMKKSPANDNETVAPYTGTFAGEFGDAKPKAATTGGV